VSTLKCHINGNVSFAPLVDNYLLVIIASERYEKVMVFLFLDGPRRVWAVSRHNNSNSFIIYKLMISSALRQDLEALNARKFYVHFSAA
jgi:hypothetical protein